MWLLDVNLPNGLVQFLAKSGIQCDTTVKRGWRNLTNGELATAASKAGFSVILTKDRLFGETAAKALKQFPQLCVVVISISQSRQSLYLKDFEAAWNEKPVIPKVGTLMEWP